MKKLFGVVAVLAVLVGFYAWAEGEVACTVSVGTTETNTGVPASGSCNWAKGSVVAMQCPNGAVFYDPTSQVQADGGHYLLADAGVNPQKGGVATNTDLCADFNANPDPYLIYLSPNEQNISLLSDGGTVVCKFALTPRKHQ